MNYIAEINAFERALETVRLSGNAQLLWYKIMCLANKSNWAEWIEVDNGRLEGMLGCGNKALIRARDKLTEKKFIEYQRGKGRGVGRYKILPFENLMCQNDTTNDTSNDTSSDTSNDTSSDTSTQKKEKKQKKEIYNINKNRNRNSNSKAASAAAVYAENIGSVTPVILQKMEKWLEKADESLIIYAIEQAVLNNKANWAYVEAILSNHVRAGRRTKAEAEGTKRKDDKKPDSKYNFEELQHKAFMNIQKRQNKE